MQYWFSPSSIHSSLQTKLETAGIKFLPGNHVDIDPQKVLLIYSSPDQILEQWRLEESTAITSEQLNSHYNEILISSHKYGTIASDWRLRLLDATSINRLCNNEFPQLEKSTELPRIMPLPGLLSLEIIKKIPKILDTYLDLELKSCLFGLEADSNYLQRLKDSANTDLVLMDWWETNLEREASYEEVANNLNQLTQIQCDYDQLVAENNKLRKSLRSQKEKHTPIINENEGHKSASTPPSAKKNKEPIDSSNNPSTESNPKKGNQSTLQGSKNKITSRSVVAKDHPDAPGKSDKTISFSAMLAKKFMNFGNQKIPMNRNDN